MANSNTQTTVSTASTAAFNKTFYPKKCLERAKTKLVHAKFGQKRHIKKNMGKTVEFRRYDNFDPAAAVNPLTEGVTPDGQNIGQSTVSAEIQQYGAYVEITDKLDKTALDDVKSDSADLLGDQLGTAIDWVTRDVLNSGNTVQFARATGVTPTNRLAVTTACVLTVNEIRRAVRTLKKNKARMFTVGEDGKPRKPHFICVCSPDATYDLQSDTLWQDVSKYSNAEQIYTGEIGRLFGVVFVESTEAKVFTPSVVNKVNANTSSSTEFVLKNDPTAAEVAYLSKGGNKLYINGDEKTLASTGSYTAATKTVTLSAAASLTADHVICSEDAGALDSTSKVCGDISSTLIFGKDAYGVIDIDGEGGVEIINKGFGETGFDPLNQRATIAAKVPFYTVAILNQLWILRIEHAVSA